MAIEQFLLVRSADGSTEKSKPFDKLATTSLSFFSCIANNPTTAGFSFLGGFAYIGLSFVSVPDITVVMGTAGNYQTPAVTAYYFNVAVFSINSSGALIMTQGTPAASQGGVVTPIVPFGNLPVAQVFYQDNGSGMAGTILPVTPQSIIDTRPFFAGNYGAATTYSNVIRDFQVTQTFAASTNVSLAPGNLFFSSGAFIQFPGDVIQFGTGMPQQTPALPSMYYNKVIVWVDNLNVVNVTFGTGASTPSLVISPLPPQDALPLALITFQDNGSGLPGSILPIFQADILDARPVFQNLYGQLRTTALDNLRVTAQPIEVANTQVVIQAGNIYPLPDNLVQVPNTTIDFGTGTYQLTAIPSGYWNRILIVLGSSGNVQIIQGQDPLHPAVTNPFPTQGQLVNPIIPIPTTPLAFVDVHDDGAGLPGSIVAIVQSVITDIRPWMGSPTSAQSTSQINTLVAGQTFTITTPQVVYVSQGGPDTGRNVGQVYDLDASNTYRSVFFGFVTSTTSAGVAVSVQNGGAVSNFTGLIPGELYYADATVVGGITTNVTTTAGQWVVPVGMALTSTVLYINPALAATAYQVETPLAVTAGESLTSFQAVYVSESGDGRTTTDVYRTDVSNNNLGVGRYKFFGFTYQNIGAASPGFVVTKGILSGFSGLTEGATYYCDPTVLGGITTTVPIAPGQWVVPVGVALSTTALQINSALAGTASQVNTPISVTTDGSTTLSAFNAVYISGGNAFPVDPTNSSKVGFLGFTYASFGISSSGGLVTQGVMNGFSSLTAGAIYYVNPSTPGAITSTIPTIPGQWVVPVGIAVSATAMDVNSGAAGSAYQLGSTTTVTAGVTLAAFTPVYISQTPDGLTAGRAYPLDATNVNRNTLFGFTFTSITVGTTGFVVTQGILNGFSGLNQGAPYYQTPGTPGAITSAGSESALPELSQQTCLVGTAVSTTALQISSSSRPYPTYPTSFCGSEFDLVRAISLATTAGGGLICLSSPFTVTTGYVIPTGTKLIGKFGASLLTVTSGGGGFALSNGAIMEGVWMTTSVVTSFVQLTANNSIVRECSFNINATSTTCIAVYGNNNLMFNNSFVGVVAGPGIGIQINSGTGNADENSVFS